MPEEHSPKTSTPPAGASAEAPGELSVNTLQQDQGTAGAERDKGVGAGRRKAPGSEGGSGAMPPFGPAP